MHRHTAGQIAALCAIAFALGASAEELQPGWDAEYTRLIRSQTTAPELTSALVDHLPASPTVPTPLAFLGYVAGAEGTLTYAADVHRYMRALEAASPRVKVFSIGSSEEGREMIAVAIADEAGIASLDELRSITASLADPRPLSEEAAAALIARGRPIYYLTGGLHSPETGSPEMLMELAYRLAVDEGEMARSIRANIVTLITPVLEVDGRERFVDLARAHQANPERPMPPFVYWGRYVAHDNNRDAVGLSLALTRNLLATYRHWHPQVLHDLHESIPFLYISTGTGPYNAWLDPIMVGEWERMATHEVGELTARGMPGVWTHGFYDGWAPNYLFWLAMGRNSIGRFYETFGNHLPTTERRVVRGWSERAWFRPNPPYPEVSWSLRNNVNYQQSGVLLALARTAAERQRTLERFLLLGRRSVAKARAEGPAAYVFPADQPRRAQLADLLALLGRHGIEIHTASRAFSLDPGWPPVKPANASEAKGAAGVAAAEQKVERSFPAGSFIVRLDQPWSRLADALLDTQYVRGADRLYDDAGWTLPLSFNVESARIVNPAVLDVPVEPWRGEASAPRLSGAAVAVANRGEAALARLRFALPDLPMEVAREEVKAGKRAWPAGTVLIPLDDTSRPRVERALAGAGLVHESLASRPAVRTRGLRAPRIALLHTWLRTQDEGWWRLALEELGIPYDYISTQDVAAEPALRARYDVILFPPADGSSTVDLLHGLPPGPPLPWKRSELTPNLGVDETEDMRPALGLAGVANLERFVEQGGLLVTAEDTSRFAVDVGLARFVRAVAPEKVRASGSLLRANVVDAKSPLAVGYDATLPVYYSGGVVFRSGIFDRGEREEERPSGRGSKADPDVPQARAFVPTPERAKPAPGEEGFQAPEGYPAALIAARLPREADRPRVVVAFAKEADTLLLSGMLEGGTEIAGRGVVVDCPRGAGHVVLLATNPIWRGTTRGTWALVLNAVMSFDALGDGGPPADPAVTR